jgi:signal transduction histidine kinase
VIEIFYDITERKKAEQELSGLQAEIARLESLNLVGQLVAGLTHEIRKPLTIVRGYFQLLGSKPELQLHNFKFELIINELDRANLIITEFLSFVNNRQTEKQDQNINDILHHLYPLIEADAFSQNKHLIFEAMETPTIPLDAKEISQLVLNLSRNGFESMKDRGTLTIRTYVENEQVVLSVQDEGEGIPSEYLDKLGTPFFTTKGNGTGLGIATCYNIAVRHNAKLDLESDSGGTTFFVRFPYSGVVRTSLGI